MKKLFLPNPAEKFANYLDAFGRCGAEVICSADPAAGIGCDALLLPGGADVDPARYGQGMNGSRSIDPERDARELDALARFLAAGLPVLGICRGLQVLNTAFGGTLHQDIPGHTKLAPDTDRVHPSHTEDALLTALYGTDFAINSAHHQAIDRLGEGLRAVQWSHDGLVEAVRHESLPIFAVQWHPERMCFARRREDAVDSELMLRAWLKTI